MQKRIVYPLALLILCVFGVMFVSPSHLFAQDDSLPSVETNSVQTDNTETANLMASGIPPVPPFVPGTVLVGLRGDMVSAAALSWGEIEVLAAEPLDLRTSSGQEAEVSAASATGEEFLIGYKLRVPSGSEWEAIDILTAREDVFFAEPDWLAQIAQSEPSRASLEIAYAINDTLYHDEQWYLQRIGISRAWALAKEESGGSLGTIDVFVIDTGVDPTHPDLANQMLVGRNYITPTLPPYDDNGHGTHVSGLAAAAINSTGMVGSGLSVRITPYKTLNYRGLGGVSSIGQAIRDAADEGADIINLSLELSVDAFALRSAVQYAVSKDVLVIAASGNQHRVDDLDATPPVRGVSYPAAYPSVLAVGATTYLDSRAAYSNRGVDLDIVAPGGAADHSILSTWTRSAGASCLTGLRTVDGGAYCTADGTSMATGIVSGVAALIMSLRPDLDADEVQQLLLDSAAPIAGSASDVGAGRLDAARAVRMAARPRLVYNVDAANASALAGTVPFVVEMPFTNPSLQPITVTVAPMITTTWYSVIGQNFGQVSHNSPLSIQLLFTPTVMDVPTLQSTLRVTATNAEGGNSVYFVNTSLDMFPVVTGPEKLYIPSAEARRDGFEWVEPGSGGRINYAIGSDANLVMELPFTMTVNTRQYNDIRVFADGFLVASGSASPASAPNECLDNQVWPSFSVYGWWSDLSVGASSSLSTFQPDVERFVIEYDNFVSQGSLDPDDTVSFQIVLHRNGQVALNYDHVPETPPNRLTVGASKEDGRFYNQVTCHLSGGIKIGDIPKNNQSFNFDLGAFF